MRGRCVEPASSARQDPVHSQGVVRSINVVIEERMANTASARKRIRQNVTRTARNQARKSRMRTFVKKVETAIASGDKSAAAEALTAAQPEMQRASGKGVIHANTVARKLSRLSARIKALPTA
jgi:small subunit ribosomal protein S20